MAADASTMPHAGNYPLNALISHAFGKVVSPMKYNDDHRVNLELEQIKRDEQEKSSSKVNLAIPEASPQESYNSKGSGSTSLHFYDSRPMTAYNYKPSPNKKPVLPDDEEGGRTINDPHCSSDLESFAKALFENLDKALDSTQKHLEERLSNQDTVLENIQKQVENLAYDSGLVDLYDQTP